MDLYNLFKKCLLVLLVIIVFGIAGCSSTGSNVIVSKERPAPRHERQLRSPGPHHMWVKGPWKKSGPDRWVWVPGHWVRR